MRLIDADELIEHVWRDKLDSRELIAQMITTAPTIKEIPTKIPITVFEQLISQEPKTGHWIIIDDCEKFIAKCSECGQIEDSRMIGKYAYCHCGARMAESEGKE